MLVHICCSVDSHFFLQKLKKIYPNEKLIGFFYDPNIHPYSEYRLRLLDVQRSCDMLGVELIEGEYNFRGWMEAVKGYENEPEKGKRCSICFTDRVEESIKKAKELKQSKVTTTLLTSPKKSIKQLSEVGNKLARKYGIEFVSVDFRKNGGTQEQFALAKKDKLYHQDYCGCIYALRAQREDQRKIPDELFVNLSGQLQPGSIQQKIKLYKKRIDLEKNNQQYEITKNGFLNYRLLRSYFCIDKKVIPSYPIFYSYMKRKKAKLKIQTKIKEVYKANRENISIVELSYFNEIMQTNYKNIKDMIYNPPTVEEEIEFRNMITNTFYSLSPVIVVESIDFESFEIYLESIYYQDVIENLVIF